MYLNCIYVTNFIRSKCISNCRSFKVLAFQNKDPVSCTRSYSKEIYKTRYVFYRDMYTSRLPLDRATNLSKDVLLYTYEKAKFFKYLGIFGLVQFFLWTYWGKCMYEDLRDVKASAETEAKSQELLSNHPLWRRVNLGEKKFRIIALASCLSIGLGTMAITFALPSRIVRYLILHKGGITATIGTYGPFGRSKELNVQLRQLSCQNTRDEAKAYISLKIKGRWLYFLLDCRGKFLNPQLFDYTVGTTNVKMW